MPTLSAEGNQVVQSLAQRHGISPDAVTHMLIAVQNGNGTMAQFCHPEFGGSGQWMQGGMTMVSDLFNYQLKSRVDNLCSDIANELAKHQNVPFSGSSQSQSQNGSSSQSQASGSIGSQNSLFVPDPTMNWWPSDLGSPAATGSQNNIRYAYFPNINRLAVTTGGEPWVYDTMNHNIGGFSQQQGYGGSITFTSQFGTVDLSTLPVVSKAGVLQQQPAPQRPNRQQPAAQQPVSQQPSFQQTQQPMPNQSSFAAQSTSTPQTTSNMNDSDYGATEDDIIATLERLGSLRDKGYITEEEFTSKKQDLLNRL